MPVENITEREPTEILLQIASLRLESLAPELERTDLVRAIREIYDLASVDDYGCEADEDDDRE